MLPFIWKRYRVCFRVTCIAMTALFLAICIPWQVYFVYGSFTLKQGDLKVLFSKSASLSDSPTVTHGAENSTAAKADSRSLLKPPMEDNISEFRRSYNFWYAARPDLTSLIGQEERVNASTYLIFRCDSHYFQCGGIGSQFMGITQGYIIANLTGRHFKLQLLSCPCDITRFLLPNRVNWTLPAIFPTVLNAETPDTKRINYMRDRKVYSNIKNMNLTPTLGRTKYVYFTTDLVYIDGFKESSLYERQLHWMRSLTRDNILSTVYKHLFKPSPQFYQEIQHFLSNIFETHEHKLICGHIRTGRNPTIPNDNALRAREEDLPKVWKFLNQHSKTDFHKIFLTSDSLNVLAAAKRQPFGSRMVKEVPGKIAHTAFKLKGEDGCSVLKKVLFEQHVLMNCDVLLISKSSLSRLSAYIRGSDMGLYCLPVGGDVMPCKLSNVKEIFHLLG